MGVHGKYIVSQWEYMGRTDKWNPSEETSSASKGCLYSWTFAQVSCTHLPKSVQGQCAEFDLHEHLSVAHLDLHEQCTMLCSVGGYGAHPLDLLWQDADQWNNGISWLTTGAQCTPARWYTLDGLWQVSLQFRQEAPTSKQKLSATNWFLFYSLLLTLT